MIKQLVLLIVHRLNARQKNAKDRRTVLIFISASLRCIFPVSCSVAIGDIVTGIRASPEGIDDKNERYCMEDVLMIAYNHIKDDCKYM